MTTPPPSRKLSTSNNPYNFISINTQTAAMAVAAATANNKSSSDYSYAHNNSSNQNSSTPITPNHVIVSNTNLDDPLANDINIQRSLSHESHLRSKITQTPGQPSPQLNQKQQQQQQTQEDRFAHHPPKYLSASANTTMTSQGKSSAHSSSNSSLSKQKTPKITDEYGADPFGDASSNTNRSNDRINEATGGESFSNMYTYSKNSIENMRRLSTEGSDYSSKCPSGCLKYLVYSNSDIFMLLLCF